MNKGILLFEVYEEVEFERAAAWNAYWGNKIRFMDLLLTLKNLAVYRSMRETEIKESKAA
jgi:hypothetical protein